MAKLTANNIMMIIYNLQFRFRLVNHSDYDLCCTFFSSQKLRLIKIR